jgi:hypothetical protein
MDSPLEPGARSRQLWDILATQAGLKFVLRSPSPCYGHRGECDASSAASPLACVSRTLESFVLTSLQADCYSALFLRAVRAEHHRRLCLVLRGEMAEVAYSRRTGGPDCSR